MDYKNLTEFLLDSPRGSALMSLSKTLNIQTTVVAQAEDGDIPCRQGSQE